MKSKINTLFAFTFTIFIASILLTACQAHSVDESDSFTSKFQIQNSNIHDIYNNLKGRAELSRECNEFETKAQCEERLKKRDVDQAQKPVFGGLTINDNFRFVDLIDSKYNADEQIITFTLLLDIKQNVAERVVAIAEQPDPNSDSIFSRKGATPETAKTPHLFGVTISDDKQDRYKIYFIDLCNLPLPACRPENAKSVLSLIDNPTFENPLRKIETKIKVDVDEAKRLKNDVQAVIEVNNLRHLGYQELEAVLVDIRFVDTKNNRILARLSDVNK